MDGFAVVLVLWVVLMVFIASSSKGQRATASQHQATPSIHSALGACPCRKCDNLSDV